MLNRILVEQARESTETFRLWKRLRLKRQNLRCSPAPLIVWIECDDCCCPPWPPRALIATLDRSPRLRNCRTMPFNTREQTKVKGKGLEAPQRGGRGGGTKRT